MACKTSQPYIPFPTTDHNFLHSDSNAGHFTPQMLRRLSRLGNVPWSESAITAFLHDPSLEHDKDLISPPTDPSSLHIPIYHYDSSSSTSSAPSDESHIIIPRVRRIRGQNGTTPFLSHPSPPTPPTVKYRNNPRIYPKPPHRPSLLSDTSDVATPRPVQGITRASSENAPAFKSNSSQVQYRQFSSEMRSTSLPHLDPHVKTPSGTLNFSPQTRSIRKKSGEPIKPSLKHAKIPSLSIQTGGDVVVQSEPTTPTLSKAVHFDPKLEHVKLFLAKQKPLAVSRDHDLTTDTSGTESDFPSFVRSPPDDFSEKEIKLQLLNMPFIRPKSADVILLGLSLSQPHKTVVGRVRVRNIAYEKWVAARFTLDSWQTTSEVTAHYVESVDSGAFDIFTFSIRFADMWSRVGDKTMFIALRYSSAGMQFWDNNNGANYMVKFVQKTLPQNVPVAPVFPAKDSSTNLLAAAKASANVDLSAVDPSLSERYQLGSALKTPGSGTGSALSSSGLRSSTYPTEPYGVLSKRGEKAPSRHVRCVTIGSSRDLEKREQADIVQSNLDSPLSTSRTGRERNHHRGYFERSMGGTPRKTPAGPAVSSPSEEPSPTRGSFPMADQPSLFERFTAQNMTRVNSESSTVSTVSDSSFLQTPDTTSPSTPPVASEDKPTRSDSYSQFLNQFCFFTGGSNGLTNGTITRSHSASDVVEACHSPPTRSFSYPSAMREPVFNGHRSSSLDSIAHSGGGSMTPRCNQICA